MTLEKILSISFFFALMPLMLQGTKKQYALITVPVCDSGETPRLQLKDSQTTYEELPFSGGINQFISCPRVHQFLFNEKVEIIDRKEDKVQIKASNAWYNVKGKKEQQDSFWIDKKSLVTFKKLKSLGVDVEKIPNPISFEMPTIEDNSVVTLIMPFTDCVTNRTYSVGTRFKKNDQVAYDQESVEVFLTDQSTSELVTTKIPKNLIFNEYVSSKQEKIEAFVKLLKKWAHLGHGFIPYVWGGSSFILPIEGAFIEVFAESNGVHTSFFDYPHVSMNPKAGFDCSSLVCRAAQIAGIPYFFKNTYTIAQNLKELGTEALAEGDLILLLKGNSYVHVMVVSSIKDNLFIEAGSYKCGYGKVHEISLDKTFMGIKTYKDLIKATQNNELLLRMHKDGSIIEANHIKVFKLQSLWAIIC